MSPKSDNQEPSAGPDVTVNIPHGETEAPPASAPPLTPLQPLPIRPITITDNVQSPPLPPTPPTPQPLPAIEEFHERRHDRHWLAVLMYVALALLVAIVVVFGGRWIYRKTTQHTTPQPAPADTNKLPPQPDETSQNSNFGSNASSAQTPNSTGSQNTQVVATNGQLPNNGPGDVIAIFVSTALAVGGLHFIYNLRKQH